MKPGDIFTDGNRTLKVIDLDGEGRPVSTVISEGEVKAEVEEVAEMPMPKRRSRKVSE